MAYGANPAIANGEGDFPSDLPASLLVRESCQVFFSILQSRSELEGVCIDIASQQLLLCCHLGRQHCRFLMGLMYQHVKLPALATILQVAILSYTGILTVMSSPSAYYKVEVKACFIPRSARGLTVHFPYSKWWHMHIQNYVEICRNCLPGDVTCTTLDLSLVNSSTIIIIFTAILQCIKIEIAIFNYFTN